MEDIYKNINNNRNKDDNEEQQQQNAVGSPFYVDSMTTESIINSNSGELVSTRYIFFKVTPNFFQSKINE